MYYVRKLTKTGGGEVGYWKESFSIYPSLSFLPSNAKVRTKETINCLLFSSASKLLFFLYAASAKTGRDLNKDFTRMGSICTTLWVLGFTEIQSTGY